MKQYVASEMKQYVASEMKQYVASEMKQYVASEMKLMFFLLACLSSYSFKHIFYFFFIFLVLYFFLFFWIFGRVPKCIVLYLTLCSFDIIYYSFFRMNPKAFLVLNHLISSNLFSIFVLLEDE